MKKQIINYIVLVGLAVVANYPIYNSLRESVEVAEGVISTVNETMVEVQNEVEFWKNEVGTLKSRINDVQTELNATIDSLKTEALNNVNKEVKKTERKVKDKVKQYIPGLPGF